MLQIFIFLLILVQSTENFCGGKQSKFLSASQLNSSSKFTGSYKQIDQIIDEPHLNTDQPNDEIIINDSPIITQLTTSTITNRSTSKNRTLWTMAESTTIPNPKENEILEQCGLAMNKACEMATEQNQYATQITIMVQVDYNPTNNPK